MTDSNNSATSSVSVSFLGLAFAVLLVLKVAGLAGASWGLANLSWWWVFSPILIGLGLFFGILLLLGVGALITVGVGSILEKRRAKKARAARAARLEGRNGRRY